MDNVTYCKHIQYITFKHLQLKGVWSFYPLQGYKDIYYEKLNKSKRRAFLKETKTFINLLKWYTFVKE